MPETTAKGSKRPKKPLTAQGTTLTLPDTPKKKTGRPSKYTPELAAEMCDRLSNGEPLRQICRDDRMPEWRTVYDWLARDPELSAQVARAREAGYEAMAEELIEISDTLHFGETQVMGDKNSTTTVADMLGHRKLRIETRLKLLACWNPSKYGTKVQVGGDKENPLKIEASIQADSLLEALVKNAELKRQANE
jgi:hypothetical protein